MRSRSTIELLGLWEQLSNPDFKPLEFERFKNEADSNSFVLSPGKWLQRLNNTAIETNASCCFKQDSEGTVAWLS